MALDTELTRRLGITYPIVSAPMAFAAGGRLAAAVTAAGGLGLIGGGYGDPVWLAQEFRAAGNTPVGCGFITWALASNPQLLDEVLEHRPRAIFLSFGDPEPFASSVKHAGSLLMCQVQTRRDADHALTCGADIIVAQGAEAGGHGERRSTLTLVPEVADLIATRGSAALLCAAGGIADGRGVAAALMLGAHGVVVGSRFWATQEASVNPRMHWRALVASGDDTVRSRAMDIARRLAWPERYTARVLRNAFTERWHGREEELRAAADEEAIKYRQAWLEGDPDNSNTFIGEAVGLIKSIEPAGEVLQRMAREATELLSGTRPRT
jgi:nitronate monooxygenase